MAPPLEQINRLSHNVGPPLASPTIQDSSLGHPAPTSLDMIRRLVAFPTVSRDSNLALIDFVADYLSGFGIGCQLTFDDDRRKANLYATLGPRDRPGICLSGHTDVVPTDGQDWHSDPFQVTRKDGRLYGRGTCDMKGFLAAVLALVPEFLERRLETPVHLALSYDEEVGCIGVRRLIRALDDLPVRPKLCIVGEPTGMKPVIGHKGKLAMRCHVRGLECHSSLAPTGVNAVEYAAELIVFLRALAQSRQRNGPHDEAFDPPFTTIHTGTVQGGTALNIVPRDCRFEFEFRNLPADDPAMLMAEVTSYANNTLLPAMRETCPEAAIEFEQITSFPGLLIAETDPATELVKALSGANDTGKVSFGTEAGRFQAADIPAVVCGPGDIAQAHKPDEYVSVEQLVRCEAFLRRLIERVSAP